MIKMTLKFHLWLGINDKTPKAFKDLRIDQGFSWRLYLPVAQRFCGSTDAQFKSFIYSLKSAKTTLYIVYTIRKYDFSHTNICKLQGFLKSNQWHKTQITIVFSGTRNRSFGKVVVSVMDLIDIKLYLLHSYENLISPIMRSMLSHVQKRLKVW